MLKILVVLVAVLLLLAMLIRSETLRRAIYVILGVLALYAVLKATGVIDAWAPDRMGVF